MSAERYVSEGRASARPKSSREDITTDGRRHPIHLAPLEAHNRSIIIFLTACTAKRRPILASVSAHSAVVRALRTASTWLVGRYIIMPDHIHFFCAPSGLDAPSLERWMRYWKSITTRSMGEKSSAVWQRHHWDRQLRSGESYGDKWDYVRHNPVRHGHVTNAAEWPYQRELNELRW